MTANFRGMRENLRTVLIVRGGICRFRVAMLAVKLDAKTAAATLF